MKSLLLISALTSLSALAHATLIFNCDAKPDYCTILVSEAYNAFNNVPATAGIFHGEGSFYVASSSDGWAEVWITSNSNPPTTGTSRMRRVYAGIL